MPTVSLFTNEPSADAVPAGHRFFERGDLGDNMYVVVDGAVEVVLGGTVVETVGPGGIFGEMALIDHRERSADAVAKTDSRVVAVDQKRFLYLIRNHPYFAVEVMTIMADRLRTFDAQFLKRQG